MLKYLPGEKWQQVIFTNWRKLQKKYVISNKGRLAGYTLDIKSDGRLLRGSSIEGYAIMRFKVAQTYMAFLIHRLVAEYFLKKPSPEHDFVIHKNYEKKDNRAINLKWVKREEVTKHNRNSPAVIKAKQKARLANKGHKLTLAQVIIIKKLLQDPQRKLTYKQIAAKYKISEMALTRMKRGENWGHVKV